MSRLRNPSSTVRTPYSEALAAAGLGVWQWSAIDRQEVWDAVLTEQLREFANGAGRASLAALLTEEDRERLEAALRNAAQGTAFDLPLAVRGNGNAARFRLRGGPAAAGAPTITAVLIPETEPSAQKVERFQALPPRENAAANATNGDRTTARRIDGSADDYVTDSLFREHFMNHPVPCYILKYHAAERDFTLCDFNPAAEQATGGDVTKGVGRRLSELYAGAADFLPDMESVMRTGKPARRELFHKYGDSDAGQWLQAHYVRVSHDKIAVHTSDITERKRIEQLQQQSHDRLALILDQMPVMVVAVGKDRTIQLWNKECERITGYSREEIIGNPKAFWMLFAGSDKAEEILARWAEISGRFRDWPLEVTCKDGSTKVISWSSVSADAPIEGWFEWSIGVDVTDRTRVEERLRRSEARFRAVVENTSELFAFAGRDGALTYINSSIEQVLGYRPDELIGRPFAEYIHPEDVELAAGRLARLLEDPTHVWRDEIRMIAKDGSFRRLDIVSTNYLGEAGVNSIVAIARDITEKKRAEDSLRESEERLRLASAAANLGLWDFNLPSGKAIVTADYATMLGYDPDAFEETETTWGERLHPDDRARVLDKLRAYLAGEASTYSAEFRLRTADGGWRWIHSIGKIVDRDATGSPVRMIGTHINITEQKELQEALRFAEEKYRILFEECPDAIAIIDTETASIVEANQTMSEILGYSNEELLQLCIPDIDAAETPEQVRAHIERLVVTGRDKFESRLLTKEGDIRDVLVSVRMMDINDQACFVAVFTDITELKRTEQELRESELRLRQIIDSCLGYIGLFDLEGRLLDANESPFRDGGIDRERVVGQRFWETEWWSFSPQVQADVRDAMMRAAGGETVRWETPVKMQNDEIWTIDASFGPLKNERGEVVNVVAFAVDITEKKLAQERLKHEEEFVRTTLNTLPIPVGVLHESGTVMMVNQSWREAAGHHHIKPELACEGRNFIEFCSELAAAGSEDAPAVRAALQAVCSGEVEAAGLTAEDNNRCYDIRFESFFIAGVRLIVAVIADVTDIQQAERKATELLNQLSHAGRVATIGETAAGIAHEINQPLAAIRLYSESCLEGRQSRALPESEVDRKLAEISRLAAGCGEIVRRMLRFSAKHEDRADESLDLADVVKQVIPFVSHEFDANDVDLSLELPDQPVVVQGNRIELQQVLLNLLRNACEAVCSEHQKESRVRVRVVRLEDGRSRISVWDNGVGISPADQDRLFVPFFTTKPSGTGLGLTISRRIVEAVGGVLDVESGPGGPTEFRVTLPMTYDNDD
jgi:PAS domain S-box-containing protein